MFSKFPGSGPREAYSKYLWNELVRYVRKPHELTHEESLPGLREG